MPLARFQICRENVCTAHLAGYYSLKFKHCTVLVDLGGADICHGASTRNCKLPRQDRVLIQCIEQCLNLLCCSRNENIGPGRAEAKSMLMGFCMLFLGCYQLTVRLRLLRCISSCCWLILHCNFRARSKIASLTQGCK